MVGKVNTHAELVLHQLCRILVQLVNERPSLGLVQIFEASLEDATPVRMRGKIVNVALERCDETQQVWRNPLDHFLDDLQKDRLGKLAAA